jgi:hypothetical protein
MTRSSDYAAWRTGRGARLVRIVEVLTPPTRSPLASELLTALSHPVRRGAK